MPENTTPAAPASPASSTSEPPALPPTRYVIALIYRRLLEAYGEPDWRPDRPPLDELVLTILSQNTSDVNSGRAFDALCAAYPTWDAVLAAPVDELAQVIRPGGLGPQKAPRIQQALRRVLAERGEFDLSFLGELSVADALAWLTSIDGVGPKTAAIVMLFCFGRPAFPVDTHITRVSRRLGLVPANTPPEKIERVWEEGAPAEWYFNLHIDLIRHGREVCRAPTPRCPTCVLRDICQYPHKT